MKLLRNVVTRFAPSPTGALHLGGARTALFNWLFARKHGGKFLLRVEDTDKERSTDEALSTILDGLEWLSMTPDEAPIFQSKRAERHREVAHKLLETGHAFWCDKPPQTHNKRGKNTKNEAPTEQTNLLKTKPVLRFKIDRHKQTEISDQTQGIVSVSNDALNDFVLLRSDGSPTYMLAVVVDDHDMGITHVIRGVDHLTNAYHQMQLYRAMEWAAPTFAHIPLVHGIDGAKLSKRHGALDINAYKEAGFLKEALLNALLRLGFGHENQEIFSMQEAQQIFDLTKVSRSPARFDPQKLLALNAHYMRTMEAQPLLDALTPFLPKAPNALFKTRLLKGLPSLATRTETLKDLASSAMVYDAQIPPLEEKAKKLLNDEACTRIALFKEHLTHTAWTAENLEELARTCAAENGFSLGKLAQPLRVLCTGSTVSPPLFEVMEILGKDETMRRLNQKLA